LSYVQLDSNVDFDSLKKNMPVFDLTDSNEELYYPLDSGKLDIIRALNCPVINIGPFGRDAHGLYERVHMPYSFAIVPELIFQTISKCLRGSKE
jgi:arginine utilization protein RocB